MRMSVVLICLGGLGLSFVIAWRGCFLFQTSSRQEIPGATMSVSSGSHLQGETTVQRSPSPATIDENFQREHLMQQIQAAFHSSNPADEALVFSVLFPQLIEIDPRAAAQIAVSDEAGDSRTELMRVLAQGWGKTDVAGATNWVAQLADSNERDTMLSCLCFGIAESDPQLAIQTLEQQGLNERRNVMLGNLAQQWASRDLQSAIAWANNYPTGETRDNLFRHIALAEMETAPAESARLVTEQISSSPAQDEAIAEILQRWAQQDMAGAFAWVKQIPSGNVRSRAAQVLSSVASYIQADAVGQSQIQVTKNQ